MYGGYTIKTWLEIISLIAGIAVTLGFWPVIKAKISRFFSVISSFSEMPVAMARIEAVNAQTAVDVSFMRDDLTTFKETYRARLDLDEITGYFTCDPSGANTEVNETYRRWLNAPISDILGWNFLNFIPEGEREELREEWLQCIRDRRKYRKRHHLCPVGAEPFLVETLITPIPERGTVTHWVGVIRRIHVERRRKDD